MTDFSPDYLFLANDGRSFFYLDNWIDPPTTEDTDVLTFYKGDSLTQHYKLAAFQLSDTMRIFSVLYNAIDIPDEHVQFPMVDKANNYSLTGDILTLFITGERVYRFSLKDGKQIGSESFDKFFQKNKTPQADNRKVIKFPIKIPTQFGIPKLADGQEFWQGLETALDVVFLEGDNYDYERKYKHHKFEINCAIDSTGHCIDVEIDMWDSVYKADIVRFFRSASFDKNEIPDGIEKWYFNYITGFRNKSTAVAEEERRQEIVQEKIEYEARIRQDSINHVYIPTDIEDCFKQLDQLLSYTDRKEFTAQPEDFGGLYHMSLGLWIRNNWALWYGSRLSHYFNELGVNHPDNMSGIVIKCYHRYLNKKDLGFEEEVKQYRE